MRLAARLEHPPWRCPNCTWLTTLLLLFGTGLAVADDADRPYRFIYNSDGGNIFIDKTPPMSPDDVYTYVDEVADTQVTTFFICPNFGLLLFNFFTRREGGKEPPFELLHELGEPTTIKPVVAD